MEIENTHVDEATTGAEDLTTVSEGDASTDAVVSGVGALCAALSHDIDDVSKLETVKPQIKLLLMQFLSKWMETSSIESDSKMVSFSEIGVESADVDFVNSLVEFVNEYMADLMEKNAVNDTFNSSVFVGGISLNFTKKVN